MVVVADQYVQSFHLLAYVTGFSTDTFTITSSFGLFPLFWLIHSSLFHLVVCLTWFWADTGFPHLQSLHLVVRITGFSLDSFSHFTCVITRSIHRHFTWWLMPLNFSPDAINSQSFHLTALHHQDESSNVTSVGVRFQAFARTYPQITDLIQFAHCRRARKSDCDLAIAILPHRLQLCSVLCHIVTDIKVHNFTRPVSFCP